MTGVAIEQMLELWCVELRQVKADLKSQFAHPSVAASAAAFLDGLLGPERRKTGWMRAEAAGDPGPWRQQAVLGRGRWEADALARHRARLCARDAGRPGCRAGDRRDRLSQAGQGAPAGSRGSTPARRARSPTARSGCSRPMCRDTAIAFIDRALYLPKAWTDDPGPPGRGACAAEHAASPPSRSSPPR